MPRLDARHGGRTTAGLVARLAERHDIALVCLRAPDEGPVDAVLRERCASVEEVAVGAPPPVLRRVRLLWSLARARPLEVAESASGEFRRRARAVASSFRPEVEHLEMERMGQYADALVGIPTRYLLVAMEAAGQTALELSRAARGKERLIRLLDRRAWQRFEPAVLRAVDVAVCYTPRDRVALEAAAPGLRVETIPLRVELPDAPLNPAGSEERALLFVGGFGHTPNVDAAVRLATRIFPSIRARWADALLYLVGDKPPGAVRRLADDRIVVTGRVEDVTPYMDRAAVLVAPLRLGGGMRVKVLEGLASGKAVVASPLAAAGISCGEGDQLMIADSDEEFASAIDRLLLDPDLRAALGRRARRWAEAHLHWEPTVASYEAIYARLAAEAAHQPPLPARREMLSGDDLP